MIQRPPATWLLGALACVALAAAGLVFSGPAYLGYHGAELYGHAWVQWWHGEALPAWPAGTELAHGASHWPVIDPLPTFLGAALGRALGYAAAWNLLAMASVGGAFMGGAALAKRWKGDPWVGGTVLALGPALAGSLASGLTEDWALGLLAGALALLSGKEHKELALGGVLLGLCIWCGLYLALVGAGIALLLGVWRIAQDRKAWRGQVLAGGLASVLASPALWLQGSRLSGEGHRAGNVLAQVEPLWQFNPWKGADLASFWVPGSPDLAADALVRMHPAYLGFGVLALAIWGGKSRWWVPTLAWVVLSTGEQLRWAGAPLNVSNPFVLALQSLPLTGLLNHYGRLLLGAQLGLAVLAARGAMRAPKHVRWALPLILLVELTWVSPAIWPLPVTSAPQATLLQDLDPPLPTGALLTVPVAGPGVHLQQPLFEQRLHGWPVAASPNRPGAPGAVTQTQTGRWLAGPKAQAPTDLDLRELKTAGVSAIFVRTSHIDWVETGLGKPDQQGPGGALYKIE